MCQVVLAMQPTVFAPSDAAFAKVPPAKLQALLAGYDVTVVHVWRSYFDRLISQYHEPRRPTVAALTTRHLPHRSQQTHVLLCAASGASSR